MTREEKIQLLEDAQVLQTGHFRLTSGRHSDKYMQCARVFEYAKYSEPICKDIADAFRDEKIDLVVGPAIGGVIITYEVARQLGVRNIFAERENGIMTLRRGFAVEPGSRVLVVEDTITTGGSVKEVIALIKEKGGVIIGVGSVVDRSNGTVDFGVPLHAAVSMEVVSYDEADCPLCKQGLPITKPGSRAFK
ncbi:orotate phosphoribosyltransferase [Oscillospiraceae bacterium LTW-04]|nr:orotate phosphoribosyltransferase [Oscillospiraceae bacterium MB24-C1]